jgi:hypothetical protein
VKRAVVLAAAAAAVATALLPGRAAAADTCVDTQGRTLWADFGDISVPFWRVFAKPGNVVGASNFILPPEIRARGAKVVYFDLNFHYRLGTPNAPDDPNVVRERATRFFDYVAAVTRCERPYIALNELFGASIPTPWTPANAQYRANVLLFIRILAERGARPFLLVSSSPWTSGEAAAWWRQVAQYADLVREVYFPSPPLYQQGPIRGGRFLRQQFRRGLAELLAIGIPPARLGLMLGFQTTPGIGGRERLRPASAWFDTVKWQALAARQVARELRLGSVWSWGWGEWSEPERDPDKPAAACVWLWARNARLCNGRKEAGRRFDASLREGQIDFPRSVQCTLGTRRLPSHGLALLTGVTGDRDLAYTALARRLVESMVLPVSRVRILAAERAVVATRFGGSFGAYRSALAAAGATVSIARGVLGDELRRAELKNRFRVRYPTEDDVRSYYATYGSLLARPVKVSPAPWWLNGRRRGVALASTAPAAIFTLPGGTRSLLTTMTVRYRVTALGPPRPLASVPLAQARPSVAAALRDIVREGRYEAWTVRTQARAFSRLACARDEYPEPAAVDLTDFLPFLALG